MPRRRTSNHLTSVQAGGSVSNSIRSVMKHSRYTCGKPGNLPHARKSHANDIKSRVSKYVLQRELNDARIAAGQTAGAADVALNFSKRTLVPCTDRKPGVQVVRKVERLSAQLDRLSFEDRERSSDREIQLNDSRGLHGVSSHVAKGARRRHGERLRIEPSIHAFVVQIRADARNLVGALISAAFSVEKVIGPKIDCEIRSGFDFENRGKLPVACKQQHSI